MFRNRLYYHIKPLVPSTIRIGIRRWLAMKKRERVVNTWPILPGSEKAPENWLGWPDGKKFAFVLTHDVEGPSGLAKCRQLMKLEMELGFRSSFNFIPEGPYSVTKELRDELTQNGFEVGVHDLHHDGKLYASRQDFARKAVRINQHLKDWGAAGFRSGFMLHNLDWLRDLEGAYDASTFDTDPFEPQPDGVGTIFPFWVPDGNVGNSKFDVRSSRLDVPSASHQSEIGNRKSEIKKGYVELPYTLPQDSTLFLLLREKTPEIWCRKLDWVAKHGGMALLIVHPDYTNFSNISLTDEFPVVYYEEFLRYVKKTYEGQYWHALPREVAELAHCRNKARSQVATATDGFTLEKQREASPLTAVKSPAQSKKPNSTIWIDLDNTPHVVFFEPIIEELKSRGFSVVVTARDAFQVCELADQKKLSYVKIGRHYGKNRIRKVAGILYRALQLAPTALREKPVLSLSHGARSQIVISNLLGIPTLLLADYEFAKYPPMMRPTWEMVPSVIPDSALCCNPKNIRKYPGIKEDVYVWKFKPDETFYQNLGLKSSDLIITVRPPATEAHYHNPESEGLFATFMEMACSNPSTRIVLLPRNKQQGDDILKRWPHWFKQDKTIVPRALDGLNLIWHSDLLVSGGGTMNREAAALGVPVYSIFRGTTGAVDRHLEDSGQLVMVGTNEEVVSKIKLEKRAYKSLSEATSRRSLDHIINTIEELLATSPSENNH